MGRQLTKGEMVGDEVKKVRGVQEMAKSCRDF